MTRSIDQARLREAAEHLEWALDQYRSVAHAQSLLKSLRPLIEAAKAAQLNDPIDPHDVPGAYNFGDGRYLDLVEPNVPNAYVAFTTELAGGLSDEEKEIIELMRANRAAEQGGAL